MKHLGLIHFILTLILFQSPLLASGAESDESGCKKLVWSDEFDNDGPIDSLYWNYETGYVRNHENQWYQTENAYCKNGLLVL